ncbi:hypothetical protein GCM10010472_72700 [Pseudonocardia halophobica]|uniref:Uncharacterized protein n=1 Tax=Pseudonocardia halophobica TaxID=29401 RepID=A0A9W6NVQ7_9PSEU|nr:hypothetical protein GCM10017577_19990 [Pseudonocardia halophobica]
MVTTGRHLGRGLAVGALVGGAGRLLFAHRRPGPVWLTPVAGASAALLGMVAAARASRTTGGERRDG